MTSQNRRPTMKDNQTKYPQLRFKGFTDPWEERKLSEIVDIYDGTHQTPIYTDSGVKFVSVENISNLETKKYISQEAYNKEYAKKQAQKGDVLMTRIGDIGTSRVIETEEPLAYYVTLSLLKPKKIESNFLSWLISSPEVQRNIWKRTLHIAFPKKINLGEINQVEVMIPKNKEQQKIGSFFKQLDDTIALHQRKLAKLKELKQGYLQKLFPRNGSKFPQLRFAGFADAWEQRKLSDVANHRGGTAIEKYFDKDGVYKVISIGSYGLNSQYVDQNIRAISNEITDGRVVNSGELTMVLNDKTANGTIIGRTLLVEKDNEYVINQRTEIISPKENFDSNFAYTILNGPFREKVKRIVQGGTQIYVNYPAVSNLNLELPKIEEQQKIGSFFKQLDDTIALHQRKLEKLQELKKGYLQKMFC